MEEKKANWVKQAKEAMRIAKEYRDDNSMPVYTNDKTHGFVMYRKQITNQPDLFKVVGKFGISPDDCIQSLEDSKRTLEWDPAFKNETTLEVWEDNGMKHQLYLNEHNGALGGLVSPREILNVRCYENEPDGSINVYFFSVDASDIPVKPNYTRAWNHPSAMFYKKGEGNSTTLTYILQIDIKGTIPFWLVRGGLVQQVFDQMGFLKKIEAEKNSS